MSILAVIKPPTTILKNYTLAILLMTTAMSPGLGQSSLEDLKRQIDEGIYPNIDAILVEKKGQLMVEEYFNGFARDSLHDTRSSFKSVTSLLAGIAIDHGFFKVDDRIDQFISEWENDPRGRITVKDLLQMKSGLACEGFFEIGPDCESEMWETDDWLEYILNIPLRHDPGLN